MAAESDRQVDSASVVTLGTLSLPEQGDGRAPPQVEADTESQNQNRNSTMAGDSPSAPLPRDSDAAAVVALAASPTPSGSVEDQPQQHQQYRYQQQQQGQREQHPPPPLITTTTTTTTTATTITTTATGNTDASHHNKSNSISSSKGKEKEKMAAAAPEDGPLSISAAAAAPDDGGPVCQITLLLPSSARHPYRIDERYLTRRKIEAPGATPSGRLDPFSISVYTLKELILREWRDEWEPAPSSPSGIRLIFFGKLLEDKLQLNEYNFSRDSSNIVHMTIRPQELADEDEQGKGPKSSREAARRGGGCNCCIIL